MSDPSKKDTDMVQKHSLFILIEEKVCFKVSYPKCDLVISSVTLC